MFIVCKITRSYSKRSRNRFNHFIRYYNSTLQSLSGFVFLVFWRYTILLNKATFPYQKQHPDTFYSFFPQTFFLSNNCLQYWYVTYSALKSHAILLFENFLTLCIINGVSFATFSYNSRLFRSTPSWEELLFNEISVNYGEVLIIIWKIKIKF